MGEILARIYFDICYINEKTLEPPPPFTGPYQKLHMSSPETDRVGSHQELCGCPRGGGVSCQRHTSLLTVLQQAFIGQIWVDLHLTKSAANLQFNTLISSSKQKEMVLRICAAVYLV